MKVMAIILGLLLSDLSVGADDLSKPIFELKPSDYCKKLEDGTYAGEYQGVFDENTDMDFVWGQGGGCIFRPIREAWGVTHNLKAVLWDDVTEFSFNRLNPIPGATHTYQLTYTVRDILTVRWVMDWHHAVTRGTPEKPQQLIVNYRKVSGTRFIPYWEGTVALEELEPGVTAFAMRNQIKAERTSPQDAGDTIAIYFKQIRTQAPNLEPLP